MVTGMREAAVEKAKDVMQSSAEQHIFITGACGAGKSTLGKGVVAPVAAPVASTR